MPPLQKRALYELIAMLLWIAVAVPIIFFANIRLDALLVFVIATIALVCWVPRYLTRSRPDQPVIMDERDKAILSTVPRYQYVGILLTVGVWIIVLLGIYDIRGQVPMKSLWLMWCSILAANALFTTAGIMIGYWRAKSPSQEQQDPDSLLGAAVTGKWRIAILVVLIGVLVIVLVFAPSGQSGPRADFTIDTALVQVGEPVQFTDTTERKDSSFMGEAAAQRWEFGDCTYSDEPSPTHAYSSPGEYAVELTVFYRGGANVKADGHIKVLP